jgi:IS1 family transposase
MLDIVRFEFYSVRVNKLSHAKRIRILAMLCEGLSMRSISRVADVSINTVSKMLVEAGEACMILHDETVRNVKASRLQCDEIWLFCHAKQKNAATAKAAPEGAGDVWTWTAIDADSKLIVSFAVGDRSSESAMVLIDDLRARLSNRVKLTTDGHKAYLEAVEGAFGGDEDYAQLVKIYGETAGPKGHHSPAECTSIKKIKVDGNPEIKHVSTNYVECQNLTMRMSMRRFTSLTNAFSKKLDNHIHALALYFVFYNFTRIHKTLRMSPAMVAGVTDRLWSLDDVIAKIDELAPQPTKRGPYKKRSDEISN